MSIRKPKARLLAFGLVAALGAAKSASAGGYNFTEIAVPGAADTEPEAVNNSRFSVGGYDTPSNSNIYGSSTIMACLIRLIWEARIALPASARSPRALPASPP